MTTHAYNTTTITTTSAVPASRPARQADAGTIRLSRRDIDGLLLVGERWPSGWDGLRGHQHWFGLITRQFRYPLDARARPGPA